jgi:ATP-dependent Clp protease ATP-binding subunit ClpA
MVPKSGSDLSRESLANFFLRWRPSSTPTPSAPDLPLSEEVTAILSHSTALADEMKSGEIRTEHLLLAMALKTGCHAAVALSESGADVEKMRALARATKGKDRQPLSNGRFYGEIWPSESDVLVSSVPPIRQICYARDTSLPEALRCCWSCAQKTML